MCMPNDVNQGRCQLYIRHGILPISGAPMEQEPTVLQL